MSPVQNRTTIACSTLEELQAQNNIIQLVAAIFAIAYGIPLVFALWLQWKAFVLARSQTHQGESPHIILQLAISIDCLSEFT